MMNCRKILPTYKLATSENNAVKPSLTVCRQNWILLVLLNVSNMFLCLLFLAVTWNKVQICKNMHNFYFIYIYFKIYNYSLSV